LILCDHVGHLGTQFAVGASELGEGSAIGGGGAGEFIGGGGQVLVLGGKGHGCIGMAVAGFATGGVDLILEAIFGGHPGLEIEVRLVGFGQAEPLAIGGGVLSSLKDQGLGGLDDLGWRDSGLAGCGKLLAVFDLFEEMGNGLVGINSCRHLGLVGDNVGRSDVAVCLEKIAEDVHDGPMSKSMRGVMDAGQVGCVEGILDHAQENLLDALAREENGGVVFPACFARLAFDFAHSKDIRGRVTWMYGSVKMVAGA
jgi:hypothetical protein